MGRRPVIVGCRCLVSENLAVQQRRKALMQRISLHRISRKDGVLGSDLFQTVDRW